jgi:hypothetical protein
MDVGSGFGIDGLQTMGIVNALKTKTGDMRVDMVIAMCIPFLRAVRCYENRVHWYLLTVDTYLPIP